MNLKLDPWKSFEIKDYNKIISEFGIEKIDDIINVLPEKNYYFTRKIVFGHKSFQTILEAIKSKKPFAMLTGLMPSGRFHLGHKIIVDLMIYLQEIGAECYVVVADVESFLTRNIPLKEAKKIAIEEYLLNYIALGLKAKKTKIYFQTEGPKSYMNLSKFVAKETTFNELKNIYGELTTGKIISAFTQMADILYPQLEENGGPKPVVVPVGVDQLPHINLSRDLANRMKTEYGFILPSALLVRLMPGLKGGKMSSSDPDSAIFLTDDAETVERKIKKYAFSGGQDTIEKHRKLGGNPDIDSSYQILNYFEPDDKKLSEIYNDYKSGKMLTSELKEITIEKINRFLKEHQKKRELARKQVDKFIFKI